MNHEQERNRRVDVVIPTFRPDDKFYRLLEGLRGQRFPISHVWIVNTVVKNSTDTLEPLADYGDWVSVTEIPSDSFDHGKARNQGASFSSADYLLFMTQDAVPTDDRLVDSLLSPFDDENVAVAYARQLPALDADCLERLARAFNYPKNSCKKGQKDREQLGIKTFFCSNVCALYSRKIFDELNRFPENMIFNEDMLFASKAIKNGYFVAYQSEAKVVHSHNYGLRKLLGRYFDLGVSQKQNAEVFGSLPSTKEGYRFVKYVFHHLKQQGAWLDMLRFAMQSAVKYLGFALGKRYEALPKSVCRAISSFPGYWRK
ncbi:MAG: glycosyltransferase family 2 protein [Paludibacteraceae bacterium]|nr:glycosyltransferase family 2 protein [Paludibacteraceae bacterium]